MALSLETYFAAGNLRFNYLPVKIVTEYPKIKNINMPFLLIHHLIVTAPCEQTQYSISTPVSDRDSHVRGDLTVQFARWVSSNSVSPLFEKYFNSIGAAQ